MGKKIDLGDVELKLRFDNLHIIVEQVGYGVFYSSIPRHRHGRTYYEAHLVCGGKGVLIAEGNEYRLEKGSLYMTGPNITHEQYSDKNELMEEYCLGFEIKRPKNSRDTQASAILQSTYFWVGHDDADTESLFEMLAGESVGRCIGYQNNIKNLISSILVSLVRSYTGSIESREKAIAAPDDKRITLIDRAFIYHCSSVSLKGLSERLDLSERQLQRFLFKQYGKSFSRLKREARRNKAKELLALGLSPQAAAEAVGYNDMRSFKKLIEEEI